MPGRQRTPRANREIRNTHELGFKLPELTTLIIHPDTDLPDERYIDLDGKQFPAVKQSREEPTGVPAYRVRVGGQRTHTVHTPNDVPAIIQSTVDLANSKSLTFPASDSPPTDPLPLEGDLWPDTSTGVTIMRRYNGTTWEAVTEVGSNVRLVAIGSTLGTDVAGNSFKRSAAGPDYDHAVYADVILANSAYVRCGATALGDTVIGLDDNNTATALANINWLLQVTVSTGAWTLYNNGSSVASGTAGAVAVDSNVELKYTGDRVHAVIGATTVHSATTTANQSFYAKVWAYQAGTVRQIAAGYAGITPDLAAGTVANANLDNITDGATYGRIRGAQLSSGNHKLTVAGSTGSGATLGDSRNLPVIAAAGLRYKFTGAISYNVTSSTAATIDVAAGSLILGSQTISYNAMSDNVTGTAGTTVTYYLYVSSNAFTAGAHTLQTTTNPETPFANDNRAYIGTVTLTYTSGTSGGGESGGGGATCVFAGAYVHTERGWIRADQVQPGDKVLVLTGERDTFEWEAVTATRIASEPCFTLRGEESGVEVTVSETTPITLRDGRLIRVAEIDGHELPFEKDGALSWEKVAIRFVGLRPVCKIECNQKTYSAGDVAGLGIATHNPKP